MWRMCARKIRTQAAWNVAMTGAPMPAGSRSSSTRRAISPAALFVKVTARTCFGGTPRTPRSHAIRWAMTRVLPLPAPASTRRGPSPAVTASRCGGFRSTRSASRSSTWRLYRTAKPREARRPRRARLFHRHRLGQVARLIHVAAQTHRDVVREELERDDGEDRREQLRAGRDLDDVAGLRRDRPVPGVADGDQPALARAHLLDVAEHALVGAVARHERHDRQVVGNQGDRPVLHLAARVALGVDVGNLLELQRPLEGDRVLEAAPEVEEALRVRELAGQRGDAAVQLEGLLHEPRDLDEVVDALLHVLRGDRVPLAAEPEAEEIAGDDHGGERLAGGDADLRPRVHVEHARRLARQRRADDVGDGE